MWGATVVICIRAAVAMMWVRRLPFYVIVYRLLTSLTDRCMLTLLLLDSEFMLTFVTDLRRTSGRLSSEHD
jgi:hypothetical protein